jgi:hypothetical protein
MNVNLSIVLEEFLGFIKEEFNVELLTTTPPYQILNGARKVELIDNFVMEYLPKRKQD